MVSIFHLFKKVVLLFFALVLNMSVNAQSSFDEELLKLKTTLVPDTRVAVFDFEFRNDTLFGKTDQKNVQVEIEKLLKKERKNVVNEFRLLPDSDLGLNTFAIINVSVANLRSKPSQSSELVSQALLGAPIKFLQQDGDWMLVQTSDKYIGWIDRPSYVSTNPEGYEKMDKVVVTTPFGFSYKEESINSETVSDIVWGDMLMLRYETPNFYNVMYPDARNAFIPKANAKPLKDFKLSKELPEADSLISSAKKMMGIPYLWGGTSWKGVDCSGFTKTVFLMNGLNLPRDASQQALLGEKVEHSNDLSKLLPGDLLFFGRYVDSKPKVVHVAISLGYGQYIHSSGMVRENSMAINDQNYDHYNAQRFLFAKRLRKEELSFLNNINFYSN